jgi:hypothetical protein
MTPFDAWSAVHCLAWALVIVALRLGPKHAILLALFAGVGWETIEPLLGIQECWINSWITDLIFNCCGALLGARLIKGREG